MKGNSDFFYDNFDAVCYLLISGIYPGITMIAQKNQVNDGIVSELSYVTVGLFYVATFFYDFYQRNKSNEQGNHTFAVLIVSFFGNVIFAVLSILIFVFLIVIILNVFSEYKEYMMRTFDKLPYTAVYPIIMALWQLTKNLSSELKAKISKVQI